MNGRGGIERDDQPAVWIVRKRSDLVLDLAFVPYRSIGHANVDCMGVFRQAPQLTLRPAPRVADQC